MQTKKHPFFINSVNTAFILLNAILFQICLSADGPKPNQVSETFDQYPDWEGINNIPPSNACKEIVNDFRWVPPVPETGSPGKIGGRINRTATPASCSKSVGPFTLQDKLEASGYFSVPASEGSGGILVGWFNSASRGWRTPNSLVFRIDGNGGSYRVFFEYGTRNWLTGGGQTFAGRYQDNPHLVHPADGTSNQWRLSYDPEGADGLGEVMFTLNGTTYNATLAPGHKEDGATFDRFGILNIQIPGKAITLYLEQLGINGEPQSLDTDPPWIGINNNNTFRECVWRPHHDFGWRPTAFAGGDSGEIVGVVWRIEQDHPEQTLVYGRTIKPVNYTENLEASGRIAVRAACSDSAVYIGWYNDKHTVGVPPTGFAGVLIEGPSEVGHYLRPVFCPCDGVVIMSDTGPIIRPDALPKTWSFSYHPFTDGNEGYMKVTLDQEEFMIKVPSFDKENALSPNRFGVLSLARGGLYIEFFMDDIVFTGSSE